MYKRILKLPEKSFFLFGPRGTGKSVWLDQVLADADLKINLLHSSEYLQFKQNPSLLSQQVKVLKNDAWIIIDEIQKLPELLDEVHSLMFQSEHRYKFALTGSSARKLKKNNGNMLAGRALSKKMFPFSILELKNNFNLDEVLKYGSLPMSITAGESFSKIEFLDAYVETYLKEEIQQEALVRNLDSFYRFLTVSAQMNGQVLNVSNIAREVGVARSTVQAYFSILEDTLIGWYLPAFKKRVKIKEVAHPKFYLFDTGVRRALTGSHRDNPSAEELGYLFETYILNEFRALNSWYSLGLSFYYWRTESGNEVDLICCRGEKRVAFEIKSSKVWKNSYNKGLNTLLKDNAIEKAYGIYTGDKKLKVGEVTVFPVLDAIKALSNIFSSD